MAVSVLLCVRSSVDKNHRGKSLGFDGNTLFGTEIGRGVANVFSPERWQNNSKQKPKNGDPIGCTMVLTISICTIDATNTTSAFKHIADLL